jgi:hypothetical protein
MSGTRPIPWTRDRYPTGRHINHDPASRRYPYRRGAALSVPDVRHPRYIPVFDQGDLGDCTANAALGILGTGRYWGALCEITGSRNPTGAGPYPFTQAGAVSLYADITANDPFDGQYPPTDTGSDGLSAAKALQRAGIIPGYQHTFSLADALAALDEYPLLVGTNWSESMFDPDPSGLVHYDPREVAGGHEWIVDEALPTTPPLVGGTTSWGQGFGLGGRFYLTVADFGRLLDDDGDVIVLTPPTGVAPRPEPPAPADLAAADTALVVAFTTWRQARGL